MKIALIAIGRLENQYAREWVEHHLKVGFDRIIIADNNHNDEEDFREVVGDYVANRRVKIENYRGRERAQRLAYNELYEKYSRKYDWLAFFDFDEFLCLEDGLESVQQLIARHEYKADCVMVPWMVMTDNNLIRNDHRPLMERFTERADYISLGKCIIRSGIDGVRFTKSVHVPYHPTLRCVSPAGFPCQQKRQQQPEYIVAYLKHFSTKTIEEWLTNKWGKGAAGISYEVFKEKYADYFFTINERTPEKEEFINNYNTNCV